MSILTRIGIVPKSPSDDRLDRLPRESSPGPSNPRSSLGPLLAQHDNAYNQSRAHVVTIRVLIGVTGISLALNMILALALYQLFPMHTVVPYLITFSDRSDQMVRIDPPTTNISSLTLIIRKEIEQYCKYRYTVTADANETSERWNSHVRLFSSQRVYNEFQTEIKDIKELMATQKFTRAVTIVSVTNPQPGTYHVDFDTFDHITGTGLSDSTDRTGHFTATLRIAMQPQKVMRAFMMMNPFGFVVTSFSVSPRQTQR